MALRHGAIPPKKPLSIDAILNADLRHSKAAMSLQGPLVVCRISTLAGSCLGKRCNSPHRRVIPKSPRPLDCSTKSPLAALGVHEAPVQVLVDWLGTRDAVSFLLIGQFPIVLLCERECCIHDYTPGRMNEAFPIHPETLAQIRTVSSDTRCQAKMCITNHHTRLQGYNNIVPNRHG